MAKRGRPPKPKPTVLDADLVDDDDDAEGQDEFSPMELREQETEASILAEFGEAGDAATWKIMMYEQTGKTGPLPYLFSCTPDDMPIIDTLRDKYGTGTYQARVYKNNKLYKFIIYAVKAPIIPVAAVPESMGATIAAAMAEQRQLMERLLTDRATPPLSQAQSMTEMLTMMKLMREAMGPQETAAKGMTPADMLGLLKTGVELGKELNGNDGGDGGGLMGVLREVVKSPMVLQLLEGMAAGALTAKPGQPAAPALAAPAAPPAPKPIPPNGSAQEPAPAQPTLEQIQAAMMVQNLRYLVGRAEAGADIALYADWVVDNIPTEMLAQIVVQENALAMLEQLEPAVAGFQGWFAELIEEVRAILTAQESGGNPAPDVREQPA